MRFTNQFCSLLAAVAGVGAASAGDGSALWGWNVSAGGNFGFGLKTNLRTSAAPAVAAAIGPTREEAVKAATPVVGGDKVVFGKDSQGREWYVDPESSWGEMVAPNETINWRLPDNCVDDENKAFVMRSGEWNDVAYGSVRDVVGTSDDVAYGASVDLSHVLWEAEDGTWGIDFTIGLTWLRSNDCYRNSGVGGSIEHGRVKTVIPAECLADPFASLFGKPYVDTPGVSDDNSWGAAAYDGSRTTGRDDDIVDLNRITSSPEKVGEADPLYLTTHGDYEEWEISAMLKPWYSINDWLCVHGMLGIGVTRSSFEYSTEAICAGSRVYSSSQEFNEWRCYGIAGAGLLCRLWDFDVSCDGLFRIGQQDMEINSRDVNGTIEKPWAVLRLGLSYAF